MIETEIFKILRASPAIRGTRVFKLDADKVEKDIWRQKILICLWKKRRMDIERRKVNYILIFRPVSPVLTMSIYLRADSTSSAPFASVPDIMHGQVAQHIFAKISVVFCPSYFKY